MKNLKQLWLILAVCFVGNAVAQNPKRKKADLEFNSEETMRVEGITRNANVLGTINFGRARKFSATKSVYTPRTNYKAEIKESLRTVGDLP